MDEFAVILTRFVLNYMLDERFPIKKGRHFEHVWQLSEPSQTSLKKEKAGVVTVI